MLLRLLDHRFVQRPVHTRLPFKFGVQVLREVPLAELQVTLETPDGDRIVGRSSDLLVPKWFEKNPDTTPEQDSAALADSVRRAVALATELTAAGWRRARPAAEDDRPPQNGNAVGPKPDDHPKQGPPGTAATTLEIEAILFGNP